MKNFLKQKLSKMYFVLKKLQGSGSPGTFDTSQTIDETLEIVSDPTMIKMIEQSQKEIQRGDVRPLRDLLKQRE